MEVNFSIDLPSIKYALDQSAIVAVTDHRGVITDVNQAFCQISQYSREELVGQTHRVINSGYHSKDFFKDLWQTISRGEIWSGDIKNQRKDGSPYWVHTTIVPVRDTLDNTFKYIAIRFDITDKKRLEADLKNAAQEIQDHKQALDAATIVAITDAQGVITYVNDNFCEISGYSKEELLGQTHQIVNSKHHSREFFQKMWRTISRGQIWNGQIKNKKKDGSFYWVETTIVPFLDEHQRPQKYMAIRKDITDKKRHDEIIEQERAKTIYAERMAALGEMSAGIAHELGNPLGAIRGRMEILALQAERGEVNAEIVQANADRVMALCDRMSSIIRGLSSYAREGSQDPFLNTSLNALITDIINFSTDKLRKSKVEIHQEGFNHNPIVQCRESQIGQVIVNLLANACDAVKNLKERWIKIRLVPLNDKVQVQIEDSGNGIPESIREKIFESFYTTKDVGHGTGLGLSVSRHIMKSHQGRIFVDTKRPHTTFVLELPYRQS